MRIQETFEQDKDKIANKYHKQGEPFDAYRRMAYHGYDFDETTGKSDEEILAGLRALKEKISALPHPVQKARAVEYVLDNTKTDVNGQDYFPGVYSLNRLANAVTQDVWQKEVFEKILPRTNEEMRKMNESGAIAIWADFDHVVPDWQAVLSLGFPGLLSRAEKYKKLHEKNKTLTAEKQAFFDAIIIEYSAILRFFDRLISYAETRKKREPESEKLPVVSACLKEVRAGAPQSTYGALMTIYMYFILCECFDSYQVRSLGNGLDSTLYSFYERDLRSGAYTREEIGELLKYFLFQWQAIGNYWGQPFYLGGTNADGSAKYNDLSYLILETYDKIGIYNPKIQLKINKNTPEKLLDFVFDMVRRGKNSFAFMCEPGMAKAMRSYGATEEESREADIRGCYETGVRANEVSSATGYVNAAKAVEYVFFNGYDKKLHEVFGLRTGKIGEVNGGDNGADACGINDEKGGNAPFETFEKFYAAVKAQLKALLEKTMRVADEYEKYFSYINPSLMYSATVEGALEKGKDAYQSGVKYNNSSVLTAGFATLTDAVSAVKEFVYEKKRITLAQLKQALSDNWSGYGNLRATVLASPHKYGNDDDAADKIAADLAAFESSVVNFRPNARGGVYKASIHSAMQFLWEGEKTAATPDGRTAGAELSKNASPSVGADKSGVTALIASALKLKPYTFTESFCLDVMLHPSSAEGSDGLQVMRTLLFAYLNGNGMAIQFNVFDAEMLRDAQKHPEKYQNLQVRVCGWNVLWNNLSTDEQNAYIRRAENIAQ